MKDLTPFQFLPPHAGEAWPDVLILGGDDGAAKGDALRVVTMQTSERFLKRAERLSTLEQRAATTDALNHIQSVQSEIRYTAAEMQEKLDRSADSFTEFPRTHLGRQLREAARILVAGVEIPVIKVTIAGFDTHSNQLSRHERLLTELAEALAAFRIAMINKQYWDRLLLMTYSEFGRRVAENQSRGTDHGTAAPHLVIGGKVKGGLYGTAPTLTQLDADNLQYTTDYRRLYATIVRQWWHLSEARWHQRFQAMDWI